MWHRPGNSHDTPSSNEPSGPPRKEQEQEGGQTLLPQAQALNFNNPFKQTDTTILDYFSPSATLAGMHGGKSGTRNTPKKKRVDDEQSTCLEDKSLTKTHLCLLLFRYKKRAGENEARPNINPTCCRQIPPERVFRDGRQGVHRGVPSGLNKSNPSGAPRDATRQINY